MTACAVRHACRTELHSYGAAVLDDLVAGATRLTMLSERESHALSQHTRSSIMRCPSIHRGGLLSKIGAHVLQRPSISHSDPKASCSTPLDAKNSWDSYRSSLRSIATTCLESARGCADCVQSLRTLALCVLVLFFVLVLVLKFCVLSSAFFVLLVPVVLSSL